MYFIYFLPKVYNFLIANKIEYDVIIRYGYKTFMKNIKQFLNLFNRQSISNLFKIR